MKITMILVISILVIFLFCTGSSSAMSRRLEFEEPPTESESGTEAESSRIRRRSRLSNRQLPNRSNRQLPNRSNRQTEEVSGAAGIRAESGPSSDSSDNQQVSPISVNPEDFAQRVQFFTGYRFPAQTGPQSPQVRGRGRGRGRGRARVQSPARSPPRSSRIDNGDGFYNSYPSNGTE